MLKIGDWPLYRFAGDAAPGDINGQGVGEVWYVVGPTGVPASLVNTRETSAGPILVNAEGMTLYAFLNDTEGESTCTGDCLANWPAAVIGEHDTSVLDPALWSTVENPEAGAMLKIGDWPLYTFAADAAPGDVNGQGVGEVWYAVAPDGHDRGRHHRHRVRRRANGTSRRTERQAPRPPRPADPGGAATLRGRGPGGRGAYWHPIVFEGAGLGPLADRQPGAIVDP